MKKKLIIILPILLILIIGIIIFLKVNIYYDRYKLPEEVMIVTKENVELFSDETFNNAVVETNAEIISKDKKINTDKIGRRKHTIDIKYDKKEYKYVVSINVIDVTAPIFITAPDSVTTTLMNIAYPCDSTLYADDYDNKPSCYTVGDYDIENVGTYDLQYILEDQSGNQTKRDVKLNVIEKWPTSSGSSTSKVTPIYFEDVLKEYKNENTSIGIDVSSWQGEIDFNKVKEAGCEFVIIRIGVQGGRDRDYSLDSTYHTYLRDAKAAGLKVGIYVYTTALNYKDGVKAANWVLDTLDGEPLDLGIAYDWENYKWFMEYEVSLHTLSSGYQGFKNTIEKAGYESHFYASKFYLERFWMNINEPVWLAHYVDETSYQGNYYMWQRTGNGKIDGVNENYVDIDILYNK